jgi:hypothetical protein
MNAFTELPSPQRPRVVVRLPVVPPSLAATMRHRLDTDEQAIFGMLRKLDGLDTVH